MQDGRRPERIKDLASPESPNARKKSRGRKGEEGPRKKRETTSPIADKRRNLERRMVPSPSWRRGGVSSEKEREKRGFLIERSDGNALN